MCTCVHLQMKRNTVQKYVARFSNTFNVQIIVSMKHTTAHVILNSTNLSREPFYHTRELQQSGESRMLVCLSYKLPLKKQLLTWSKSTQAQLEILTVPFVQLCMYKFVLLHTLLMNPLCHLVHLLFSLGLYWLHRFCDLLSHIVIAKELPRQQIIHCTSHEIP